MKTTVLPLRACWVANRVSAKNQDLLLEKGVTAKVFLSWLIYGASKSGNNILDPVGMPSAACFKILAKGLEELTTAWLGLPPKRWQTARPAGVTLRR